MDRKLIDYLPEVMQEYEEFKQLMACEQETVEKEWHAVDLLLKEGFLDTETEKGASRWEGILGITPKDMETLYTRNSKIKTRLQDKLPYYYRVLERILIGMLGTPRMLLDIDGYKLTVKMPMEREPLFGEVVTVTDRIVPANMIIDLYGVTEKREESGLYVGVARTEYLRLSARPEASDVYLLKQIDLAYGISAMNHIKMTYPAERKGD